MPVGTPTTNFGDFTYEMWQRVVQVNLNACFLCANHAFRMMRDQSRAAAESSTTARSRRMSPRRLRRLYRDQARDHRADEIDRARGREYDICSCQIDIGNAATPLTARSVNGQMQPYGQMAVEPRMDVDHVGQQVLFMSNLPLNRTCSSSPSWRRRCRSSGAADHAPPGAHQCHRDQIKTNLTWLH